MDRLTKHFFDYLYYIVSINNIIYKGVVTSESTVIFSNGFNEIMRQKKQKTKNILSKRQILIQTMKKYFSLLSVGERDSICLSIVTKFFNNKYKANSEILIKLPIIYSKSLKEKFTFWKSRIIKKVDIDRIDDLNSSFKKFNIQNQYKSNLVYNYNNVMTKRSNSKIESRSSNYMTNRNKVSDFLKRMESFEKTRNQKSEHLRQKNELQIQEVYTFIPNASRRNMKLNERSKSKSKSKSTFDKLYEDQFIRKENQRKNQINYLKKLRGIKVNKLNLNKVDWKKIEELYNDYKKNNTKRKELMVKLDDERGITFKPNINVNFQFTRPKTSYSRSKYENFYSKTMNFNIITQNNMSNSQSNVKDI